MTILCASDIFLLLLQNIASWRGIAYLRTLGGGNVHVYLFYTISFSLYHGRTLVFEDSHHSSSIYNFDSMVCMALRLHYVPYSIIFVYKHLYLVLIMDIYDSIHFYISLNREVRINPQYLLCCIKPTC